MICYKKKWESNPAKPLKNPAKRASNCSYIRIKKRNMSTRSFFLSPDKFRSPRFPLHIAKKNTSPILKGWDNGDLAKISVLNRNFVGCGNIVIYARWLRERHHNPTRKITKKYVLFNKKNTAVFLLELNSSYFTPNPGG